MKQNHTQSFLYLFFPIINLLVIFGLLTVGCHQQNTINRKTEKNLETTQLFSPITHISNQLFQPEIKATKPWKIAYILKTTPTEPYWRNVKKGAENAAQEFGVNLSIISPNKPQTTEFVEDQIILMANLIETGGIDGIIIGPADSIRLVAVVEKATRAGIPVIAMDTPLNTEQILTFVGFDNFTAGKLMGEWVVKKLGGQGKVVILDGAPNHDNTIARRNGFIAGLNTGKIKILATASAKWNQAEARNISAKWLKNFDKVDAIIAANDSMALGASQAVKDANYQGIIITGFDGLESGIQGIKTGEITATINQAPEKQARLAIQLMIRHLENQEFYPNIVLLEDIKMITIENIENYYLSP